MADRPADKKGRTPAEERKERLKAALRDNLRRRKAPEAERQQPGAPPEEGQGRRGKPGSRGKP
jgi:hypothetical protein